MSYTMSVHLRKTLLLSKTVTLKECYRNLTWSVISCESMIKTAKWSIQPVLNFSHNEIPVRACFSASDKGKMHWRQNSIMHKTKQLSQYWHCIKSATAHCKQYTRLLASGSRHMTPYLLWRHSLPQPTLLHTTRSFITSSAVLASDASSERLLQENAANVPIQEVVVDATPSASSPTILTTGAEPEYTPVHDSAMETVSNAHLLFPDFPTIRGAELTIQKLHELTGLPWWATITLTAVTLRLFLIMPLSLYSLHNAEKLNSLQPEIVDISKRLKQEVSMAMHQFKWNEKKAKEEYIKNMKRLIKDLQIKNNCHPMKNTASFWLQFPVWISVSYSLRNLTSRALRPDLDGHEECQSLTEEGALWFSDLTATDLTWILPVMMGSVTLFNIEMTHLNIGEVTKYRMRLTLVLRCLALLFIPISSTMPTAMVFYWVNSGFLAAVQNMLHDYSPFRRLVGLGQSPTESKSPAKALVQKAKLKYLGR